MDINTANSELLEREQFIKEFQPYSRGKNIVRWGLFVLVVYWAYFPGMAGIYLINEFVNKDWIWVGLTHRAEGGALMFGLIINSVIVLLILWGLICLLTPDNREDEATINEMKAELKSEYEKTPQIVEAKVNEALEKADELYKKEFETLKSGAEELYNLVETTNNSLKEKETECANLKSKRVELEDKVRELKGKVNILTEEKELLKLENKKLVFNTKNLIEKVKEFETKEGIEKAIENPLGGLYD